MSKRSQLPYSTQDLFPQVNPGSGAPSLARNSSGAFNGGASVAGSIVSTASSITFPSSNSSTFTYPSSLSSRLRRIKVMLKRLFKPTTLDFETATWEIFHLIINPKKMYRGHYYYKQQTKNGNKSSYTRDDPSFLILLTCFLSISAIAWGLAYSPNLVDILRLIVYMVLIDFYLTGFLIATISWFVTNKVFNSSFVTGRPFTLSSRSNINYIEWGFCFDIHCNSFLVIWCLLYVLQFLLLPILRIKNSIFSLILGNSLYFGSVGYYFVISLYGFSSLPLNLNTGLARSGRSDPVHILQMIVLAGILPVLGILWFITLCFRFNVADRMVDSYFN